MKRFVPSFVLILVYAGCTLCSTKKINCPAFEDPFFDQWFPYTQNALLRFKGPNAADTLNFFIQSIYESPGYESTQGGFNGGGGFCLASKDMFGRAASNMNEYISIRYDKDESYSSGGQNSSRLSVDLIGNNWIARSLNNNSISAYENNEYNVVDSGYSVNFSNGVNYPVLATITNDTIVNKTSRFYRLFIAKGFGIIGFDEYPSNKRWVVQ